MPVMSEVRGVRALLWCPVQKDCIKNMTSSSEKDVCMQHVALPYLHAASISTALLSLLNFGTMDAIPQQQHQAQAFQT
jgi:hypothetical protein